MNRATRSINTLCALLVAGGGLTTVAGWVLHIEMLTRLNSAFIPTYFNTALCFALYGLGLGALNWQWRWIGRRTKGGTGLGLHITRELVERMGGKIGFDSAPGQGTTFWVEFPLAEALEEPELAPAPAASALPRILHVEDDADLTAMLAAALKGRADLVAARTLKEAKAKLKTQAFDAIILDIGMPDGSGLSLIQGITKVANPPPVIILSAREIEEKLDTEVAAILVKSRIAENEIADKVMAVVTEQVPHRRKAAS